MIIHPDLKRYEQTAAYKALWRLHAPYVLVQCEYNSCLWRVLNMDFMPVGVHYPPAGYLERPARAMVTHDISMQLHDHTVPIKGTLLIDGIQFHARYFWKDEKPSVFRADNCAVMQRYDEFNTALPF